MRAICAALLLAAGAAHGATNLQARDINGDGTVDAFFDPSANLTWVADANLAGTQGMLDYPWLPGAMTWNGADSWATSLDLFGVTGWRLPHAFVPDCAGQDTDPEACFLAQHNYAVEWVPTTDPFANVMLDQFYWFGPLFTPAYGGPLRAAYTGGDTDELNLFGYAWAVHDGDVPSIPEPATYALMVLGIAALVSHGSLHADPARARRHGTAGAELERPLVGVRIA